jgi:hypothetical protein
MGQHLGESFLVTSLTLSGLKLASFRVKVCDCELNMATKRLFV